MNRKIQKYFSRTRATLLLLMQTLLLSGFLVAAIFATYLVAAVVDTPLDPMGAALAYTASVLSVCVGSGFLATLVMLIYLGVREHGPGGLMETPFYLPQLIKHAALFAVTAPGGLRGIDRIFHHSHLTWMFLTDPEVIVLGLAYYFAVLVASLWFNGTWVVTANADRVASRKRVARGIVAFEALIVIGCIALYCLGS